MTKYSVTPKAEEGLRQARERDEERLLHMKAQVQAALDDPRPSVPMDEAFDRLEAKFQRSADDPSVEARIT